MVDSEVLKIMTDRHENPYLMIRSNHASVKKANVTSIVAMNSSLTEINWTKTLKLDLEASSVGLGHTIDDFIIMTYRSIYGIDNIQYFLFLSPENGKILTASRVNITYFTLKNNGTIVTYENKIYVAYKSKSAVYFCMFKDIFNTGVPSTLG